MGLDLPGITRRAAGMPMPRLRAQLAAVGMCYGVVYGSGPQRLRHALRLIAPQDAPPPRWTRRVREMRRPGVRIPALYCTEGLEGGCSPAVLNSCATSTASKRYCAPQNSQSTEIDALLGQDVIGLAGAQALDHAAHTLAAAGAGKARRRLAHEGLEALQLFFPEQAAQNRLHIQRQQLLALEAGGQRGDAVVVLVHLRLVQLGLGRLLARKIAHALDRQALDQQAGRHLVVRGQHQRGLQLLALPHVVLQHVAELIQRPVVGIGQRHHALVGLLPGQALLGVQRDGAAAQAMHVDHVAEHGVWPAPRRAPSPSRAGSGRTGSSATASLTGPSPKICRISEPLNLMLDCISTPAATISPSRACTGGA